MKRVLSIVCIVIMVGFMQGVYSKEANAATKPEITFVGVGHSPLVEGDTETFMITSNSTKQVQYKIFLNDDTRKTRKELTEGYTELGNSKIPYEISPEHVFDLGKYKLEIWVREEGSVNEYDNTYTANLNCVSRDNKNRVYTNGDMIIEKDTYKVGEKVVISGIKNIGGITGPYKYRLHIFSPNKIGNPGFGFDNTGWAKNVTRYDDRIEWMPQEPGTYVLDAHVITPNSTLWKNVQRNQDIIYGGYEAWKLKTITVVVETLESGKEETRSEDELFIDNLYKTNSPYWNQGVKIVDGKLNLNYYDYVAQTNSWKTLSTTFNSNINSQLLDVFKALYTPKEDYKAEVDYNIGEDNSGIGSITLSVPSISEFIKIHFYTSVNATISGKNVNAALLIPQCTSEKFNSYKSLIKSPLSVIVGETNTNAIYDYITSEYKKCVLDNSYNITKYKKYDKTFGAMKVSIWSNSKRFVAEFTKQGEVK